MSDAAILRRTLARLGGSASVEAAARALHWPRSRVLAAVDALGLVLARRAA